MDQQETIKRLEGSFNLLAPRAQELADRFYANLFAQNPTLRPMFPADMSDQKGKLVASLVLVVKNLRTPEKIELALEEMGARHVEYGAQAEHYPVVRDMLVDVMGQMAGEAWTDQLKTDWTDALNSVAAVMVAGAKKRDPAYA